MDPTNREQLGVSAPRSPQNLDGNPQSAREQSVDSSGQQEALLDESRQKIDSPYEDNCKQFIELLRQTGQTKRSDQGQPSISDRPPWFREDLFKNAQAVYARHFMGINFAHLSGLLLLVRVDSIYRTLSKTEQSDTVAKLFKRYYHTVRHVKSWYEGDIFNEEDPAYRSLLIVRGMHNRVSSEFNESKKKAIEVVDSRNDLQAHGLTESSEGNERMVHISEYDIMITQFAFIGFIVIKPENMGLLDKFDEHDLDSLLHFWRFIGYYLGASDRYNLCAYERSDIMKLCEAIKEVEYRGSLMKNLLTESPPGIMSLNIVRSVKFIPMLTIYGIMRYLYEIMDHELSEIEHKKNWYSNLSYTFINIVMTRFLAYRPLRSFNNGLTRLSVFLVGKVEDWFAEKLQRKYGNELKA